MGLLWKPPGMDLLTCFFASEHCKYVWVILIPTFSCSEYPPPPPNKKIHMLFVCLMSVQCDFSLSTQVPILNHSALSQFTARNLICWGCSQCILLGCCVDMKRYTNSIFYCTVKGTLVCVNTPPPRSIFCLSFSANLCYLDIYIILLLFLKCMHTDTSYKHAYIGFADPLRKETVILQEWQKEHHSWLCSMCYLQLPK